MAREKMFDPAFQKAFTESIHKENNIRRKWHLEYGPGLKRSGAVDWSAETPDNEDEMLQEDSAVATVGSACKKCGSSRLLSSRRVEEAEEMLVWPSQSTTGGTPAVSKVTDPPAIMKPVQHSTKKLLYQGISHDGEGRASYLKSRYKRGPEDRYYFPVCSNWEYGWTYGKDIDLKSSDHGRRQVIKKSFYRPNDPQLKPAE